MLLQHMSETLIEMCPNSSSKLVHYFMRSGPVVAMSCQQEIRQWVSCDATGGNTIKNRVFKFPCKIMFSEGRWNYRQRVSIYCIYVNHVIIDTNRNWDRHMRYGPITYTRTDVIVICQTSIGDKTLAEPWI